MASIPFMIWTSMFLLGLIFVAVSCQTDVGYKGGKYEGKICEETRQKNIDMFLRINEKKIPALMLNQIVTGLEDLFLPINCLNIVSEAVQFNPSSARDQGGPLGTLGGEGTIYTTSSKTRSRRSADDEEEIDADFDLTREKRSSEDEFEDEELRVKRSADARETTNNVDDNLPLEREKRFLNGMPMGGSAYGPAPGAPKKEISESAKMMSTLLMLTRLQRKRASMLHREVGGTGFYGERMSFGNGMYGDAYPGRKKRAASIAATEDNMAASEQPKSRKKRFLFLGEPGDAPPPMPSMMSTLMGTAVDPNTGKRIEFGGDYMKRMMRRNFVMNAMPFAPMPPAGKEHTDFVKNMAPIWYMQRFTRNRAVRLSRPVVPEYFQRRQPNGYYGDTFPGK